LLNRTTRRLTPTEAGVAFYERAKLILESVDEAECVVSGFSAEPRGVLKINAPMSFGARYLGALIADYQRAYPQVNIDISLHDRQVDVVDEGYDLVLRIATLEDSSLIARKLAPCHIVLCASPEYIDKFGEPKTPEELKNHPCLLYTYNDSNKTWALQNAAGEIKQIPVSGSLIANNGDLICDAMIKGMGVSALPTFIVGDAIRKGDAKVILPEWRPPSSDISLLYPSNKHLSAKVRTFVDMAVDYFKVNSWD